MTITTKVTMRCDSGQCESFIVADSYANAIAEARDTGWSHTGRLHRRHYCPAHVADIWKPQS